MALDLSASGVASLIKSFLASDPHNLAQSSLAQDVRYANPHNLAALIKWTLARLGRFYAVPVPSQHPAKKGEVQEEMAVVQQRGWLDIDSYLAWRERERGEQARTSCEESSAYICPRRSQPLNTPGLPSASSAPSSTTTPASCCVPSSPSSPRRPHIPSRTA